MFICDKCGLCCTQVDRSPIYSILDGGDGVCKYLNRDTKLCSIYDNRPIMCNIDEAYRLFLKDKISLEEYYRLNYEACNMLKKQGGREDVFKFIE